MLDFIPTRPRSKETKSILSKNSLSALFVDLGIRILYRERFFPMTTFPADKIDEKIIESQLSHWYQLGGFSIITKHEEMPVYPGVYISKDKRCLFFQKAVFVPDKKIFLVEMTLIGKCVAGTKKTGWMVWENGKPVIKSVGLIRRILFGDNLFPTEPGLFPRAYLTKKSIVYIE